MQSNTHVQSSHCTARSPLPRHTQTLYDTMNVMNDRGRSGGGAVNPTRALAATRLFELVLDALPQTYHQLSVLVQLKQSERGNLLWFSLLFSGLSIAFVIVVFEYDIDTSSYRQLFSRVHGYWPNTSRIRKVALAFGIACFVMGHLGSRMGVMAILGAVNPALLGAWMACECLVLLFARAAVEGSIRWNQAGLDSLGMRCV